MKASELSKSFVAAFREEISGGGVEIEIPELGIEFYVFPVQPDDTAYFYKEGIDKLQFNRNNCARLICARAKTKDCLPWLDNEKEKDTYYRLLTNEVPSAWTEEAASRVIAEIEAAYPAASIEEAGNESEETPSSDSISI